MAAVFALVFLFVLASVGLLFKVVAGDASAASVVAFLTFFVMGAGVFYGLFRMARNWEHESDVKH